MAARTTIAEPAEKWTGALEASRDRLLPAAGGGGHGVAVLAHASAGRIVAAWTLDPAPIDPATHLEQTHTRGRRHLRRLLDQPADAEVRSPMTNQLFDRDRKSTRLNSSHGYISYAVFCLKKKKKTLKTYS